MRLLLPIVLAAALLLSAGWSILVLLFAPILPPSWRAGFALAFALATLLVAILWWRRGRPWLLAYLPLAGLVLLSWLGLRPLLDGNWQPDVARTPTAEIEGDRLTIHNLRNFAWGPNDAIRAERWEERSYDLSQLRRVDLVASHWAGDAIAHMIVSFGFADGQQLAMSIEARKERGEAYSAVNGFFRNNELIYVAADERDLLGVRAIDRGERVYLYRMRTPPDRARALLMDYVQAMNRLAMEPEFYNSATTNCTTQIGVHVRDAGVVVPRSWKVLVSGYAAEYAYELGALDTRLPFDELRRRSFIVDAAKAAADAPDFSTRIRQGLPDPLR
jgi:hypothetical protein